MDLKEALETVAELAEQNIIDDPDYREEGEMQDKACDMVRSFLSLIDDEKPCEEVGREIASFAHLMKIGDRYVMSGGNKSLMGVTRTIFNCFATVAKDRCKDTIRIKPDDNGMYDYPVPDMLVLDGLASSRHDELTRKEDDRGYRAIGGDKGDLHFRGYDLYPVGDGGTTVLYKPVLHTSIEGLSTDEVQDIAEEILQFSFDSIGLETVEHS